jgi:hypothetical protein
LFPERLIAPQRRKNIADDDTSPLELPRMLIRLSHFEPEEAQYVMKVQAIRSKKQPPRFYVNIPLPLAAALDLEAGEEVQWKLLGRSDLRLRRLAAPGISPRTKK